MGLATRGIALAQDTTLLSFGFTWDAAFRPVQEEFNNNFMEAHPEIEIEAVYSTWADHNNTVPVWAAAGTLPDIIYVHGSRVAPWTAEGILTSLQAHVDADPEFNVEGIWEEALRLYRVDGELVGIPYDHGPLILGYNKDIFDAAGMDYPSEDWTMDDLRNAALDLTDPGQTQWGWSGELDLGPGGAGAFIGGWGATTMNEDETEMTLDTDEAREALNFWYTLIHDEGAGPTAADAEGFGGLNGPWLQGRCAMAVVPSWETPGAGTAMRPLPGTCRPGLKAPCSVKLVPSAVVSASPVPANRVKLPGVSCASISPKKVWRQYGVSLGVVHQPVRMPILPGWTQRMHRIMLWHI